MTPEEWILAFMTNFEETGELLDKPTNEKDSIANLIGSYFITSIDVIPYACWLCSDRQTSLTWTGRGHTSVSAGIRSAVRV
jgi:hypothetical protein